MNPIRKLISDFNDLPNSLFFAKYFFPFLLVLFAWMFLGSLVELTYKKEYLQKMSGRVSAVKEIVTVNTKSKDYELWIYLDSYSEHFRITDNFKYRDFQAKLALVTEVRIYIRPKYFALFGLGREYDIYHLERGDEVLFDLKSRKANSTGIMILGFIAMVVFGVIYVFQLRKLRRYLKHNKANYKFN